MKVLLLKDVYKLGRAGEVKRVADGYGRNYLLPQGLAMLATSGALKQAERIREQAAIQRAQLNQEMSGIAERLQDVTLVFPARASETGKLYGSVTTQMISEALSKRVDVEISRRQIDAQPIRALGEYEVPVRLTIDLVPTINVIVHREGESIAQMREEIAEAEAAEEEAALEADLETAEIEEVEEELPAADEGEAEEAA